jgi:hypothetical protein
LNVFRTYLRIKCKPLKARIFIWLRKAIPESSILQDEFIRHLKDLIEIDKEESRLILEAFFDGR